LNETLLWIAERLAREVYWRSPHLRRWLAPLHSQSKLQVGNRQELKQYLREIGMQEGALVMAHTAVANLQLTDADSPRAKQANFLKTAPKLLDDLQELVGPTGTLAMPTHPHYQMENDYVPFNEQNDPVPFDPQRTYCCVGLVNELFWRRKGVQRSLHPLNTLAACGPLADELLRDNLNEHKPLPHGIYSGYYRFCQHNGLVVSIGIPLRRCLTLLHVAEDVRDEQWPIKDFFRERRYRLQHEGCEKVVVVRKPDLHYSRFSICWFTATHCLLRDGILHEGKVGGIHVGWARAKEILDYCMERNATSTFPYYAPKFLHKKN
jgi:aminoglycoside 3-N-acetyltransferase